MGAGKGQTKRINSAKSKIVATTPNSTSAFNLRDHAKITEVRKIKVLLDHKLDVNYGNIQVDYDEDPYGYSDDFLSMSDTINRDSQITNTNVTILSPGEEVAWDLVSNDLKRVHFLPSLEKYALMKELVGDSEFLEHLTESDSYYVDVQRGYYGDEIGAVSYADERIVSTLAESLSGIDNTNVVDILNNSLGTNFNEFKDKYVRISAIKDPAITAPSNNLGTFPYTKNRAGKQDQRNNDMPTCVVKEIKPGKYEIIDGEDQFLNAKETIAHRAANAASDEYKNFKWAKNYVPENALLVIVAS